MKIGLVRIAYDIANLEGSINGRETLALYDILKAGGNDVTLVKFANKKSIRRSFLEPEVRKICTYDDIPDPNVFDVLIMISGSINFFNEPLYKTIVSAYNYASKFDGRLIYFMTDASLPFKDIWKYVKNTGYEKVDRSYVDINNEVSVISHFSDIKDIFNMNSKTYNNIVKSIYFPFSQWVLTNSRYVKNLGQYDLIYGGLFRTSNKKNGFEKYYIDSKLPTYLYGTTKADLVNGKLGDVSHIKFGERVKPDKVIETNTKGLCTVVLGTPHCDDSAVTLRVFESILSNCVTFIDEPFDSSHYIFGDFDFLYVNTTEELVEKVKKVKEDEEFRQMVLAKQHEFIDRCKEQNLPELMNEAMKEALSD